MAVSSEAYSDRAKRYLKAELKRAGLGYKELAERLSANGVPENTASVRVKVNRGTFAAWFLIASLEAIGTTKMEI